MTDGPDAIHRIVLESAIRALGVMDDVTGPPKKSRRKAKGGKGAQTGSEAPESPPTPATGQIQASRDQCPAGGGGTVRPNGYSVERMNREWGLVLIGNKAVILREQGHGPLKDRIRFLSVDAFKTWLANRHMEIEEADGTVRKVPWSAAWLVSQERRQYEGIEFRPDPADARGTHGYLNLWRGFAVEPKAKPLAYPTFADHLLTNVCRGDARLRDWVFGWFAHMIQRPRERVGTALVLRGRMGTGKSKVGEIIGSLFPSHFSLVDDGRYVVGQFNAHMASCLLLQAEEAVWAGDKEAEGRLKSLVTSSTQMIEGKGLDPFQMDNFVHLIMTSNEEWIVPAGKEERRFCVIDVGDHCAQNHDYFAEMDRELADGGREALLHDLLTFDLSKINVRRIPATPALLEQKIRSLSSVDSWWYGRLDAGAPTTDADGWAADVPRAKLFADYLTASDKIGVRRRAAETEFGMALHRLVPGLKSARRTVYDGGEGRRTWMYVLPDLAACRAAFEASVGQTVEWLYSPPDATDS